MGVVEAGDARCAMSLSHTRGVLPDGHYVIKPLAQAVKDGLAGTGQSATAGFSIKAV
jgi:hypothetical protein